MSTPPEETPTVEGLRERHITQSKPIHFNAASKIERAVENGSSHAGKEKRTFGRTPGGISELFKFPWGGDGFLYMISQRDVFLDLN